MSGTTHLVGDFENGKVYQLVPDPSSYQESPSPIFSRTFPHLAKACKRLFLRHRCRLLANGGSASMVRCKAQPERLSAMVNDGGKTWSDPIEESLGKFGKYNTRVKFDRLGSSRDRVFEVLHAQSLSVNAGWVRK
jgi:hypothetical protein